MTSRCARCQRFKASDGLLFCRACAPADALRQDATVTPAPIRVQVSIGGASPPPPVDPPAASTVNARVRRGRASRLVAKRDRGMWNHDRQAHEERTYTVDRDDDFYSERWRTLDTGEVTFEKVGAASEDAREGEPPADRTGLRRRERQRRG